MPKAKPSTKSKGSDDPLLNELVTIRKLLVYALLRTGASQKQIGAAIGVSQASISRMFLDASGKVGPKSLESNNMPSDGP
jgi:predicted transcriptional regulator